VLVVILAISATSGCGKQKKSVTIASKQYTENILLSEMLAQLVEAHTDISVSRKQNLGGTSVCFLALQKGEVDIYPEYSGTAYNEILKLETDPGLSPDEIYDIVNDGLSKEEDITIFSPIGINNTYALGMLREKAEELGITKMSDLTQPAPTLIFGANHLYYTRIYDGYDAMVEIYNMQFKESLKMDTSLLYDALSQGQVDVMVVYATDSLLKKYDMVVLDDDMQMYPPYHGMPIIRNETLKKYPELSDVLDLLSGRIDNVRMQELNYEIDVENKQPEDVAKQFLTDEGLL
jgi:osmoprotectant transport system substrate-binding protein